MKFINLALYAAVASGAAIQSRAKHVFQVTSFSAQHTPHSIDACAAFRVDNPALSATEVYSCFACAPGLNNNGLPLMANQTCTDNSTTFQFLMTNPTVDGRWGYALRIQRDGYKAHKHWPTNAVAYFESPPGSGMTWAYLNQTGAYNLTATKEKA